MITYVLSLKRSAERRRYIKKHVADLELDHQVIDAVDGSLLSEFDLEAHCDMTALNKVRDWLTNDQIGCSLSHYNIYEEFLKTGDEVCFIVEDDVLLPTDIKEVLSEIEETMAGAEIILLHYLSLSPCKLSSIGKKKIFDTNLMFALNNKQLGDSTAYLITRSACENMLQNIKPVLVAADSWNHYYKLGCFDAIRVQYPNVVKTKNFKSSINYFERRPILGFISKFINDYKVPGIFSIVKYLRKKKLEKYLSYFSVTDEISPHYNRYLKSNLIVD